MGNWRNRPRRFSRNRDRTRGSYWNPLPEPFSDSVYVEDGVPMWEKKFCSIVGVPWRKIVDAKKFAYCHPKVLEWDDSAAEDALQSAKTRFWGKINDLPCEISLPDPDMYVDEVNWDADVDPELIKDLDKARRVHEGKDSDEVRVMLQDGCNKSLTDDNNPWETCNKTKSYKAQFHGWNLGGSRKNANKDKNPWESSTPLGDKGMRDNAWGCSKGNDSWEWKHSGKYVSKTYNWNSGWDSGDPSWPVKNISKDQGWSNARDISWGCFQKDSRNSNNESNHWGHDSSQCVETANSRAWGGDGYGSWTPTDKVKGLRGRGAGSRTQKEKRLREREYDPYWKQPNKQVKKPQDVELTRCGDGWRARGEDWWSKGGDHRYIASYKGTRLQGNNY